MLQSNIPVFVKIEEYKDVLDTVNLIKSKMMEARNILSEIESIKQEEDAEVQQWTENIEELEGKISQIDKALFEPE